MTSLALPSSTANATSKSKIFELNKGNLSKVWSWKVAGQSNWLSEQRFCSLKSQPTMDTNTVVIDAGSYSVKAGFSGNALPSVEFPTVVGTYDKGLMDSTGKRLSKVYVGDEVYARSKLIRKSPIERGMLTESRYLIEDILHHAFQHQLQVKAEESTVIMTENPIEPKANRTISPKANVEYKTQVLFETFKVQGLCLANHCTMTLFSTGKVSGTVVDSGGGVTHTIPVYEGFSLPPALEHSDISGKAISDYLEKLLVEKGHSFNGSAKRFVRDIQEKSAAIRTELHEVKQPAAEVQPGEQDPELMSFQLPDGQKIELLKERYQAPEILFQPTLINSESNPLHQMVFNSITKCDVDLRPDFYKNIVVGGGNSHIPGFIERLTNEVKALANVSMEVVVSGSPGKNAAWVGSSIVASSSSFQNFMLSTEEYEDSGPSIIHRKCYF
jgi:actin